VSKTILVTGGSRGIGGAVALEAASLGWAVAVGSRRTAQRPNPSSRRSRSEAAVPFPSSVTSRSRPTLCGFDEAEQALGALDGVVINAGIVAPSLPLAVMDEPRLRLRASRRTLSRAQRNVPSTLTSTMRSSC
jgi:NAD(P)-dependent dehydrogenase (short-subunit alcohol dehydrogenase family)